MGNRKNAGKIALASLLGLTGTALAAGSGALASYTGHGYRQTLDEAMEPALEKVLARAGKAVQ